MLAHFYPPECLYKFANEVAFEKIYLFSHVLLSGSNLVEGAIRIRSSATRLKVAYLLHFFEFFQCLPESREVKNLHGSTLSLLVIS